MPPPRASDSAATAPAPVDPARSLLVGSAYFVLHLIAHCSAGFFEVGPGGSLWYPPAGLALAFLVLVGPRFAWLVFAANLTGAWLTAKHGLHWSVVAFPLLVTGNYTAAAILVRRLVGPRLLPGTPRETAVFVGTVACATAGSAAAGLAMAGLLAERSLETSLVAFVQWWLGDACGVLTVVPAAMVFAGPWVRGEPNQEFRIERSPRWVFFTLLRALALGASLWLIFAVEALPRTLTFNLCLPPLVWICLRHGLPGATLATLAITMGGLLGMRLVDRSLETSTAFLGLELACAAVGLSLGSSVSRRNRAERTLADKEALLDRVIAGAQVGLWDWNLGTDRFACNRRCREMMGGPLAGAAPSSECWRRQIHPADRDRVETALRRHLAGETPLFETEYRHPTPDGAERWVHLRGSVVARDRQNRPLLVSGTLMDVSDRKRAESEAGRLVQILEATTDLVFTCDPEGRILHGNAALLRFLQVPDLPSLRGRPLAPLLAEPSWTALAPVLAVLPDAGVWTGELPFGNRLGTTIPVSAVGILHRSAGSAPGACSFVLHDISRRKQQEAARLEQERRLLQLQKTESLGVLAGGIAHDFNNLLTAMLGNVDLARLELVGDSPLREPLEQIEFAARRAADLCQQMLAYAGRRPLAASRVDLNALIGQTQKLFRASLDPKIAVELSLSPGPVLVEAEPPQLQQLVLNLVINAAEAIGDCGGRIAIRTDRRAFSADELRAEFNTDSLPGGLYSFCEVEDSGRGIAPEHLPRIFEPFFSTKQTGHGLGLAAVYGVVTSHRGAIAVHSRPGQGSRFRFVLPLAAEAAGRAAPVEAGTEWRAAGLALIVDDEPSVRQVMGAMVHSFGFETLLAADGEEAVAVFRQHADRLRFVLLDLIMPRMNGTEALGEFHRIAPAVPVVLMSGFVGNIDLGRFPAAKPAGLLAKPFSREALRGCLAPILGNR